MCEWTAKLDSKQEAEEQSVSDLALKDAMIYLYTKQICIPKAPMSKCYQPSNVEWNYTCKSLPFE